MKEIIGMKLSDALCKIPDDKIICIGAATGFVFCGKKRAVFRRRKSYLAEINR